MSIVIIILFFLLSVPPPPDDAIFNLLSVSPRPDDAPNSTTSSNTTIQQPTYFSECLASLKTFLPPILQEFAEQFTTREYLLQLPTEAAITRLGLPVILTKLNPSYWTSQLSYCLFSSDDQVLGTIVLDWPSSEKLYQLQQQFEVHLHQWLDSLNSLEYILGLLLDYYFTTMGLELLQLLSLQFLLYRLLLWIASDRRLCLGFLFLALVAWCRRVPNPPPPVPNPPSSSSTSSTSVEPRPPKPPATP
jgi:hypothetical protein